MLLVAGFGRQPLYDEIGAAARNIHRYTVIGFWQWLAVGLIVRIETPGGGGLKHCLQLFAIAFSY